MAATRRSVKSSNAGAGCGRRLWRGRGLGFEQQLVGEREQIGVEVPADHVAQQRAQMVGDLSARASPRRRARTAAPFDDGALQRDRLAACARSAAARSAAVAHSAARRAARAARLGGSLGLEQRAQREQVVGERLVGARRARSRARSAAAPTRARCRAARGARRGCRSRAARPPARRATTSMPRGRPPAPSASGFHDPSPTRAHASAPSVTRPSPNSRSARSRSVEHLAPTRERLARIVLVEREHHDEVTAQLLFARGERAGGRPCSACGWAIVRPFVSGISAEVIVSPCRLATSVTSLELPSVA